MAQKLFLNISHIFFQVYLRLSKPFYYGIFFEIEYSALTPVLFNPSLRRERNKKMDSEMNFIVGENQLRWRRRQVELLTLTEDFKIYRSHISEAMEKQNPSLYPFSSIDVTEKISRNDFAKKLKEWKKTFHQFVAEIELSEESIATCFVQFQGSKPYEIFQAVVTQDCELQNPSKIPSFHTVSKSTFKTLKEIEHWTQSITKFVETTLLGCFCQTEEILDWAEQVEKEEETFCSKCSNKKLQHILT